MDEIDIALFAVATKVTVNSGQQALFWTSSWINGTAPALLFPNLYRHSKRKKRTVADAMHGEQWIRDISHDLTADLLS